MSLKAEKNHRWAVVLAGGDGTRLRELTRRVIGDARPKQFCRLFGEKTLLAQTRERIAPLFEEEHTLFVLTRAHREFYGEELAGICDHRKVVQPLNRGTAVAMALCLEEIARRDEDATVAFFPSDHYFRDCSAFRDSVEYGLQTVEEYPQSVLVLGAEAHYPEVEYGWIQPGRALVDSLVHPLHRVRRFWEKPTLERAESLRRDGCMWNTFVTIGLAGAFLELFAATIPGLTKILGNCRTESQIESFYEKTAPVDFSGAVLSHVPERLLVLRDGKSGWMDLGNPHRVMEALSLSGAQPPWLASVHDSAGQLCQVA